MRNYGENDMGEKCFKHLELSMTACRRKLVGEMGGDIEVELRCADL